MKFNKIGRDFWNSVNKDVARAHEIVRDFERIAYSFSGTTDDAYNEEEDFLELEFKRIIKRLKGHLLIACDVLGAEHYVVEFKDTWKHKNVASWEVLPWIGEVVAPALDDLVDALNSIRVVFPDSSAEFSRMTEISRIERILAGTPKMVTDYGVSPSNEAEVRKVVYQLLLHFYPDTVREIPIPKAVKTYKPDLGVKSLKIAIEYKFIDSETELKAAIGGIYEDVHGYADSEDWTDFIAVLYMTDQFMTPSQIEMDFRRAGAPPSWRIIPVTGKGKRKAPVKRSSLKRVQSKEEDKPGARKTG